MFTHFLSFDWSVFAWIETHLRSGAADAFFKTVTHFGDGGLFWLALGLVLLLFHKTRRVGVVVLAAMALDVIATNVVLKHVFARPRPFALQDVGWWVQTYVYPGLIEKPDGFSFPSGHAAGSFAGASAIFFASKPKWVGKKGRWIALLPVVLAALVAFSRVYLEVHYASDVIAGTLVGILCGCAALLLFQCAEPLYTRINAPVVRFTEKLRRQ
ncbi:MAG: phosphatase PAP2 family protein [Oscillospiraceae bacterium]|jgi:undecaprenyl-diphosphatase|nr:phosphatase PAP2 family protein [Oscillospiraceae bacterium]